MFSHLLVIGSLLLQVPVPQPPVPINPSSTIFRFERNFLYEVPDGPLPWELPAMPSITIDLGASSSDTDEIEHSDGYLDTVDDIKEKSILLETPLQAAVDSMDQFLGDEASLPDMSETGDFEVNFDAPEFEDYTAYQIAAEFGTNVGTTISYAKAMTSIIQFGSPTSYILSFILLCVFWMIFITLVVFALQFVDMLFSVIARLVEMIPVVE